MLLFAATALIILSFTLFLHYHQHFRFKIFETAVFPSISRLKSNSATIRKHSHDINKGSTLRKPPSITTLQKKKCICSLQPVDDQEFSILFPMSFLTYLIFVILLTSFICSLQILDFLEYENNKTINELILFTFSIGSYGNNTLFEIHKVSVSHISDYVLVYGVMILLIWESLFSFYRFYSTYRVSITLKYVSTSQVLKYFMIYVIIYSILYILTMHLYYWVFPSILLMHSIFNFYCNWKFVALLLAKYKIFTDVMEDTNGNKKNHAMLHNIYFMKRISLIGCSIQFIYLSAFIITYNMTTICTLPLLWSLNSLLLSTNFVRNREAFKYIFICCNHTKINKSLSSPTDKSIKSNITPSITKNQIIEMEPYQINTVNKPNMEHSCIERKDIYHHQQKQTSEPLNIVHLPFEEDLNTNTFYEPSVESSSPKKKALFLLGTAINNRLLPLNQEKKQKEKIGRSNTSKCHTKSSKSAGNLRSNLSNPILADGLNNPISLPKPSELFMKKHISAPTTHSVNIQNEDNSIRDLSIDVEMVMEMPANIDDPSPTLNNNDNINGNNNNDNSDNDEEQLEMLWLQQQRESIKEAKHSFDVLSKYGFCSKSQLNSMNELVKYNKRMNKKRDIYRSRSSTVPGPQINELNHCSKFYSDQY